MAYALLNDEHCAWSATCDFRESDWSRHRTESAALRYKEQIGLHCAQDDKLSHTAQVQVKSQVIDAQVEVEWQGFLFLTSQVSSRKMCD